MVRDIPAGCGYTLYHVTPKALVHTPYRADFLGIALCIRGTARLTVNVDTYDMQPDQIVVVVPGSMVHVTDVSPDWEAKLICVTRMELLRDAAAQILPEEPHRHTRKPRRNGRENRICDFQKWDMRFCKKGYAFFYKGICDLGHTRD